MPIFRILRTLDKTCAEAGNGFSAAFGIWRARVDVAYPWGKDYAEHKDSDNSDGVHGLVPGGSGRSAQPGGPA